MTNWQDLIAEEKKKEYFRELNKFLVSEMKNHTVYPEKKNWFKAFDVTPFEKVKVVIIGQDPYHGEGQAQGLSFSVPEGFKLPPSLKNIYKEIEADIRVEKSQNGDLTSWAEQGVLLLNSVLTVRAKSAGSHQKKGWEKFTDRVVEVLNEQSENLVFILWGAPAQKKGKAINREKHLVLEAPHPSPLSSYRGFFGCQHFSKTNRYLMEKDKKPIVW